MQSETIKAAYGSVLYNLKRVRVCAELPEVSIDSPWETLLAAMDNPSSGDPSVPYFVDTMLARKQNNPTDHKRDFREKALLSIFSHINGEHGKFYLPVTTQQSGLQMPQKDVAPILPTAYEEADRLLQTYFRENPPEEPALDGLLNLLEDCWGTLAAPVGEEDISLYDHVKISMALSCCISEYFLCRQKTGSSENPKKSRDTDYFLLYSADLSGIQKFIYGISENKALRVLRSRSFFLSLMMEHYVDELLRGCALSRANLLYSGGGHCYLLLPNTPSVIEVAESWNQRFNDFLLEQFGTDLFLGHGYTACCCNDLMNIPAEDAPYKEMFRRVSGKIAAHKMHRYRPAQLLQLNRRNPEGERECVTCGRADTVTGEHCRWCQCFINLSRKIQNQDVFLVSSEDCFTPDFTLPALNGNANFIFTDEKTARRLRKEGRAIRKTYTKNRSYASLYDATRLYVGDYASDNLMDKLAADSTGIRRIGMCRMDVDNLGQTFVSGFEDTNAKNPQDRYRYVSLCRTAAFSRQMSLFFQLYINEILSRKFENKDPLSVTLVYSGGDDIFLVGAWNDVIEAANRIQAAFEQFTCGSITISGGIGVFNDHFPIRIGAEETAELEDRAKQEPGKNAVSLFDPRQNHNYSWNVFQHQVKDEKEKTLEDFFKAFPDRENSFLYGILKLLRSAQEPGGGIHLARYAYQLARLEPKKTDPNAKSYEQFAKDMYRWAWNPSDREQLITAIYLYVYKNRKGVEHVQSEE